MSNKLTQFQKRKAKESDDLVKKVEDKLEEIKAAPKYTQTGYDIYSLDGGRSFGVAEISYDAQTREAKVIETYSISRLVALKYENMKTALKTLKRKAIKTGDSNE